MNSYDESNQLREMVRILERKFGILKESEYSCCGISMAQCHALIEIGRVKNISLNDLAELLNLENSTMSRTVNNLVKNDLVKRDVNAQDRRYVTISLTDGGNSLFKSIEEEMNQHFRNVYNFIPENKKLQVLESIQILLDAIGKSENLPERRVR